MTIGVHERPDPAPSAPKPAPAVVEPTADPVKPKESKWKRLTGKGK